MTGVFIRGREDTERNIGKMSRDNGGRDYSDTATIQRIPRTARSHQKLGKGKEASFPRAFRGSVLCQHLDL